LGPRHKTPHYRLSGTADIRQSVSQKRVYPKRPFQAIGFGTGMDRRRSSRKP
jgi:hypothetical protein